MRRSLAVLAALALTLAACSDSEESPEVTTEPTSQSETTPSESSDSATDAPEAPEAVEPVISDEGMPKVKEEGDIVTLDFTGATDPGVLQVAVVTEGTGREVTADDMVVAHYVGQVWGNDTPFDSSYERGAPTAFPLSGVVQGWRDGLSGQKVGSRVIISVPSELGYGPSGGNSNAGIGPDDTIAFVVDIVDAFAADTYGEADAKPVENKDLPVEITGELGAPVEGLKVKDGVEAPEEKTTTILAEGSGERIVGGATVYVQYTATTWDNATVEKSSDFGGLQSIAIAEGNPFDGLIGIPVGSRALIQIPQTESAPGMVAVVDIVGQVRPADDTE